MRRVVAVGVEAELTPARCAGVAFDIRTLRAIDEDALGGSGLARDLYAGAVHRRRVSAASLA